MTQRLGARAMRNVEGIKESCPTLIKMARLRTSSIIFVLLE